MNTLKLDPSFAEALGEIAKGEEVEVYLHISGTGTPGTYDVVSAPETTEAESAEAEDTEQPVRQPSQPEAIPGPVQSLLNQK